MQALLHYAFPSKHDLLFGYDYQLVFETSVFRTTAESWKIIHSLFLFDFREAYYSSLDKAVRLFRDISDWHNELERTIRNEKFRKFWRLSTVNVDFKLCRR